MTTKSIIESIIFIANRPLSKKELAKVSGKDLVEVESALNELINDYEIKNGGIKIIQNETETQMVTSPENSQIIQVFLKQEVSQELTPASLETLSIIAYRSPISRRELEQIRGVNCSIILRNLLIRGLIVEFADDKSIVSAVTATENEGEEENKIYQVSLDFIKHLGINDLKELPNYEKLNKDVPLSSLAE